MGTQGKGDIASTRVLMIPLKDMMGDVFKVHPGPEVWFRTEYCKDQSVSHASY